MSEIKTPITKLVEGRSYIAGSEDYLITERHTLSDILRFLIEQSSVEEIQSLIETMEYD